MFALVPAPVPAPVVALPARARVGVGILAVLILGGTLACRQPAPAPDPIPFFVDPLAQSVFVDGQGEPMELDERPCPDVTRRGLRLPPGSSASAPLELPWAPSASAAGLELLTLDLEGCAIGEASSLRIELGIHSWTVELGVDRSRRLRLDLPWVLDPPSPEAPSPASGPLPASIRLMVPRGGGRVHLQELAVEGSAEASALPGAWSRRSPPAPAPAPALAPASAPASGPPGEASPPPILLISVDTLRADMLFSGATPHLDALAAEAQVWDPHYAAASWTQPSHASLLTGQPPRVHGIVNESSSIHPGVPTLAERFADAGLSTGGLVHDNVWLREKFGFGRGFDVYRSEPWALPKLRRAVSNWLTEHRAEPFFFFFHTFEPHSDFTRRPYESPEYYGEDLSAELGGERYGCRQAACASRLLDGIDFGHIEPLPGEIETLAELYRRGVEATDRELGLLFDHLRVIGLWDRLLLVVTSDHGEAFEGPGRLMHGKNWEEILRVPLIIKWPAGTEVDGRSMAVDRPSIATSALDLAPTLLEAAGLDASGLPGRSLRHRRRAAPVLSGTLDRTVIHEAWKLRLGEGNGPMLFDLESDPEERHDLLADGLEQADPGAVERFEALAEHHGAWARFEDMAMDERDRRTARLSVAGEIELSEEERQRLLALGYLGGNG